MEQLSVIPKAFNIIARGLRLASFNMRFDFPDFELGNFVVGPAVIFEDECRGFIDPATGCEPTRGLGNKEASDEDHEWRNNLESEGCGNVSLGGLKRLYSRHLRSLHAIVDAIEEVP